MRVAVVPVVIGALRTVSKLLGKRSGRVGIRRTNKDNSIVKIGLNTLKSSGDLQSLAVTESLVIYHQLTLV